MTTGVLPSLSRASCKFLSPESGQPTKKLTLLPDNTGLIPEYVHNSTKAHIVPLPNFADLYDPVKMAPKTVLASEVPASELEHYKSVEKESKLLQVIHTVDSLYDKLMRQKALGLVRLVEAVHDL
jgi:hypothetical protein